MASAALLDDATLTGGLERDPAAQSIALSDTDVLWADAPQGLARPSPALLASRMQVRHLLMLPRGWNSHAAEPITEAGANAAADLLGRFLGPGVPAPAVVPRVQGGLQLEWHTRTADVEVYIEAGGEVSFYCKGPGEPFEGALRRNEAVLAHWLRHLA